MVSGTALIPKHDVGSVLRKELLSKGIDPSRVGATLRIERVSGHSAVLINWIVQYVNTTGRRDFASYVNKSGKNIVFRSFNSLKVADFKVSEYSIIPLREGVDVSVRSEVRKAEAKGHLTLKLCESLKVPKSAVKFLSVDEVIIADEVLYSFEVGANRGEVRIGKGSPKVTLEPLPAGRLESIALASLKDKRTVETPRYDVKREERVTISRSWDFLFDGKPHGVERMAVRREASPEVIVRDLSGNVAVFMIKIGDELKIVQVNRYSGEVMAKLPAADPEELKGRILRAFTKLTPSDPSEVEFVRADLTDLYRIDKRGNDVSLISLVKLRAFPYIYSVRYEHSSGKVDLINAEVDKNGLRAFLVEALGTSKLNYEFEERILYVRAKRPEGWSFMMFDLRGSRRAPDLVLIVDKIFYDPETGSYVIFCRPEGSSACLTFLLDGDLRRASGVFRSRCVDEITEEVRSTISSRFEVKAFANVEHEQRVDRLIDRIDPRSFFSVSSSRGDAFLHFTGFDAKRNFMFKARYSIRSGTVTVERPLIMEETPKRIVERALETREVSVLSYKYDYPSLRVRVRRGNEVLSLKFDLIDLMNPVLVERKVHKGILGRLTRLKR
ncbi:MAG: hypothetical protein QXU50_06315 [Candidatus Korarchaeum sp.]